LKAEMMALRTANEELYRRLASLEKRDQFIEDSGVLWKRSPSGSVSHRLLPSMWVSDGDVSSGYWWDNTLLKVLFHCTVSAKWSERNCRAVI